MKLAIQSLADLFDPFEPAMLGPERRPGALDRGAFDERFATAVAATRPAAAAVPLVRALALLWHDHLDAAHAISQDLDHPDGSFVHGLMHRREPDFGNAAYWFRRVGEHPAYATIAAGVCGLPTSSTFKDSLVRDGRWHPLAMIDACEAAAVEAADADDVAYLRQVQRVEFRALLESVCRRHASGHV